MLKKIKQTKSEKLLLIFLILLAIFSLISFTLIKNKCLFVEKVNLTKLKFNKPENIVILNVPCGNVVIELFPSISPNSVERFKKLIKNKEYDNVAFHRVVKNFLVQAGDLEFGRKENINYTYIGSGRSKYDLIKPETDKPFEFKRGTVAFAKSKNGDAEDSEFLILLADAFLFEGEYTPLGRVVNGISALEKIKFNDQSEYVLRPDFINSLKMFSEFNKSKNLINEIDYLFSEDQGRYIIEINPKDLKEVTKILDQNSVYHEELGIIIEKDMIINQKTKVTIDELKSYNSNWLTNFMSA